MNPKTATALAGLLARVPADESVHRVEDLVTAIGTTSGILAGAVRAGAAQGLRSIRKNRTTYVYRTRP